MSSCNLDGRFSRIGNVIGLPEMDSHSILVQPVFFKGQVPRWKKYDLPKTDMPVTTAFNMLENIVKEDDALDWEVKLDEHLFLEIRRDVSARRGFRVMSRKALV